MPKKPKVGRPKKEPSQVIAVPLNRIKIIEKIIERKITVNQEPTVRIRVPKSKIKEIQKVLV